MTTEWIFYAGIVYVIFYAGREVWRSWQDDEFERESRRRMEMEDE